MNCLLYFGAYRSTNTSGQAYDSHCNLVLGEVEETIYVIDDDDETESVRVRHSGASQLELHANDLVRHSRSSPRCCS